MYEMSYIFKKMYSASCVHRLLTPAPDIPIPSGRGDLSSAVKTLGHNSFMLYLCYYQHFMQAEAAHNDIPMNYSSPDLCGDCLLYEVWQLG